MVTALDLETYPITPGCNLPTPISYSLCDASGVKLGLVGSDFKLPEGQLVNLNIAFDMGVLYQHTGVDVWGAYEAKRVTDVAIRQQLIDIADGQDVAKMQYGLEPLAKRLLKVDLGKNKELALSFHTVVGKPPELWTPEQRRYASLDTEAVLAIYNLQERSKYAEHMHRWEHFEAVSHFCLRLMEAWGIRADPEWWALLKADVDIKYAKLQSWFKELGVLRPDGTKDKKRLQDLVFEAYRGKPPRTDKGAISTDRQALKESGDPTLERLTGDGPVEKIVTTYGKVVETAAKGVYNPRYNVLVRSGRTSGNFQQWPRGGPAAPEEVNRLRACFIPRPGYVYCSVDFTGAELVALAQVCYKLLGYSNIRDALNNKQDLHLRLAARFMGITYDKAQELKKIKDSTLGASRQSAKPVNFGVPGLMGPERLAESAHAGFTFFCELSGVRCGEKCPGSSCRECIKLAQEYIKGYHQEWPEVKEYHKHILSHTTDPFPAPLTGFLRGKVKGSEACNFPFQHLTSRMAKSALMTLAKECYTNPKSPVYGVRLWGFAHDEILAEVPEDRAPEAADEMCRLMLKAAQPWVPDVYLTAEPALMRRWWKGAECVRDSNGVLQVWEPKL